MLAARWKRADRSLCHALLARYSEPHRRYHTLQHLAECFAAFDEIADLAEHPPDVELALWFHDAIYDTEPQARANLARPLARALARL